MLGVQSYKSTSVRLPAENKRGLRIQAAMHDQSLSSEIIARLRRSLNQSEAEQAAPQ